MATTLQMYDEIARILRETRNNVEYEGERNNSQLLRDVATTLCNLATLVQNVSNELKTKQDNESTAFAITFAYLINKGYADDFMAYLKERESKSGNDFIMQRFTKRV